MLLSMDFMKCLLINLHPLSLHLQTSLTSNYIGAQLLQMPSQTPNVLNAITEYLTTTFNASHTPSTAPLEYVLYLEV